MLTVDDLKQALPKTLRTAATQSLADLVNNIASDPEIAQNIRENCPRLSGTHRGKPSVPVMIPATALSGSGSASGSLSNSIPLGAAGSEPSDVWRTTPRS